MLFKCIISWWVIDMHFYAKRSYCFKLLKIICFILLRYHVLYKLNHFYRLSFLFLQFCLFCMQLFHLQNFLNTKRRLIFDIGLKNVFRLCFQLPLFAFALNLQSFLFVFPKFFLMRHKQPFYLSTLIRW